MRPVELFSVLLAATALPAAADSATAFNPEVSLILSGQYARRSVDPAQYTIPGFPLAPEARPGANGFALAESELVIKANADDFFSGRLIVAITPENTAELEEAALETLALPAGLTLTAGRFKSSIGYLNSQHPHTWDFTDVALPYRALLGGTYGDDGVRVRWLAPTTQFLELGAEALRGANWPGGGDQAKHEAVTAFVRTGGDVGDSHAWRAGLSWLRVDAGERLSGNEAAPDAFRGRSRLAIADVVWKWAPHGNARERNFRFQAEYLRREEGGTFTADLLGTPNADTYQGTHSGWYAQAVYQFRAGWRVGVRHESLSVNALSAGTNAGLLATGGQTPTRTSAMLDYARSERSRLRFQFTADRSTATPAREFFVQYVLSLGAHGAHSF